jgi:hypothetical protein
MKKFFIFIINILILNQILIANAKSIKENVFIDKEKFTYSIYAGWIRIGTASLLTEKINNNDYKITCTIDSNYVLRFLYPVHNINYSYINFETLNPYNYIMDIDVKKKKFYVDVKIDQKNRIGKDYLTKMVYDEKEKKDKETTFMYRANSELLENIQDPLSILYYFRSFLFDLDQELKIPVYADGKNFEVAVSQRKRKKLQYVDAYKEKREVIEVIPDMKFPGILPEQATMKILFTDDDKKIPVYAEVKMGILKNAYCYLIKHEILKK